MTGHRRTARAFTLGAGGAAATSLHAFATHPWLALAGLYIVAVLAWAAVSYRAAHHRQVAERDWTRRRVLGEQPGPLDPCCILARHSDGAAHDGHRCTDEFHRIVARHLAADHTPGSST
ncbi:hypothetical protein [Streptomyces sp. NPDC002491]